MIPKCIQCHVNFEKTYEWEKFYDEYSHFYLLVTQTKSPVFCEICMKLTLDDLKSECDTLGIYKNFNIQPFVVKLHETDAEFFDISKKFMNDRKNGKIFAIEKIFNPQLTAKFNAATRSKNGKYEYLFHASKNENYNSIITNGFDILKANTAGLLGAGIYGAKYSEYSDTYSSMMYVSKNNANKSLQISLLCNFFLDITHATLNPGSKNHIFAVYDQYYAIPEYLIYFWT